MDLELGLLQVLGKGRRPRILSIGKRTSRAMDRYLRVRTQHRDAMADWLWLGRGGGQRHVAAMTTLGIRQVVWRRESEANPGQVHPHQLRHSLAHDWLATPGNMEGDLMHLAGWRSRTMLSRYVTSAVSGRALEAHKRSSLSHRV